MKEFLARVCLSLAAKLLVIGVPLFVVVGITIGDTWREKIKPALIVLLLAVISGFFGFLLLR